MRAAVFLFALLVALACRVHASAPDGAGLTDHGVVLLFHRVSDEGPASTRIAVSRFEALLEQLERQAQVVALSEMTALITDGTRLPENAVAITFDDAYESVFSEAFPRLRARAMPFTIFVATDPVDQAYRDFMSWDQLRTLAASGLVSFASHSLSHGHLEERTAPPTPERFRERVRAEVLGADRRLRVELPADTVLRVFAYPYGEHSAESRAELRRLSMPAFTQGSGALGPASDPQRLPRFPIATGYDSDARLRSALLSRPLLVTAEQPSETVLGPDGPLPSSWSFRLAQDLPRADELACYGEGKRLPLHRAGDRVSVSLAPLKAGRNRVNCTVPVQGEAGAFHWLSRLWLLRDGNGIWLER